MASRQGIERLTAREVQTAKADVNDGGGLSIRVPPPPAGIEYNSRPVGDVAQLGERRVRNAKVGSSILLVSTTTLCPARARTCRTVSLSP